MTEGWGEKGFSLHSLRIENVQQRAGFGYAYAMSWHILPENRQKVLDNLVAVAVAYDEVTAQLVQSYLIDHCIIAFAPELHEVPLYPPVRQDISIWVPRRKREEAIMVLRTLAENRAFGEDEDA